MRKLSVFYEHILQACEQSGKTIPEVLAFCRKQGISAVEMNYSLFASEKDGENTLPDIITNNEVRMALTPLLRVENDVSEITEMLTEIYIDTKQKKGAADGN